MKWCLTLVLGATLLVVMSSISFWLHEAERACDAPGSVANIFLDAKACP